MDAKQDAARELIRTYRESDWRTTRLEVLRELHQYSDLRSFLFLVHVILKNEDLAEQQCALEALGQWSSRSAQLFLRSFFAQASDTLKPLVAYALGQTQDFHAIPLLLAEWGPALARKDSLLLKNLVIALGELKAFEALPKIRLLLTESESIEPDLMLACMFALARLERDPARVVHFKNFFVKDSLRLQIYKSALSQIQIRSQFKLEDYLGKIFNHPNPHPVLPHELRAFDKAEVELGLTVFDHNKQPDRYLLALQGVDAETRVRLLKQFLIKDGSVVELIEDISPLLNQEIVDQLAPEIEARRAAANPAGQLLWLDALAPFVRIEEEGDRFLFDGDETLAIQYLNLWNEWSISKGVDIRKIEDWIESGRLQSLVYARLVRACAELSVPLRGINKRWRKDFNDPELRSSILFYFENLPGEVELKEFLKAVSELNAQEVEELGVRILAAMEAIAQSQDVSRDFFEMLKTFSSKAKPEFQIGVLKILRHQPHADFEEWVLSRLNDANPLIELNAVIAAKFYPSSREASDALAPKLESPKETVRGRALDSLCAHTSLLARRAVMDYLSRHLDQDDVVDKVHRSFDPENRGGGEFALKLEEILGANPDHLQWEKLVSLRNRISTHTPGDQQMGEAAQAALAGIDQKLVALIPRFARLDSMTQAALRAAEQPFYDEEMHHLPVDKAPTVLEYCKALDLILDRLMGQKELFPKLEAQLHDFQTLWHRIGFGDEYPNLDRVMTSLGLKGKIAPEHFPLHKAKTMCETYFNGKILQDRFKIFDGLRAWAVIFLIFTRRLPGASASTKNAGGPLLKFAGATDDKCISIAKRLMTLQDLRNPAAHRQTYMDLASVTTVRNESIQLLNTILEVLE